jgi:hypothetical protein
MRAGNFVRSQPRLSPKLDLVGVVLPRSSARLSPSLPTRADFRQLALSHPLDRSQSWDCPTLAEPGAVPLSEFDRNI